MKWGFLTVFTIVMVLLAGCAAPAEPAAEEAEQTAETEEIIFRDNGLPVLFLQIDPQEFVNVNESEDHSCRAKGASITANIRIIVE